MVGMMMIASFVSYRKRKKFAELRLYYLYPISALAQILAFFIAALLCGRKAAYMLSESSVNIFLFVEVGLYYLISFRAIRNSFQRAIILTLAASFLVSCAYLWTTTNSFFHNSERLAPLEALIMLIPSCIYFLNLFRLPASINLFDQPIFWINIGVLFTFFCILPINLLEYFMSKFVTRNLDLYYSIIYFCYTVNYFFVARAYLCQPNAQVHKDAYNLFGKFFERSISR